MGISGNFNARVRRHRSGKIDIHGRLVLGDFYATGYPCRGLPSAVEIGRSGVLRVNGRVLAGDGTKLLVPAGVLTIGDRTRFDGDTRIICTQEITIGEDCTVAWGVDVMDNDFHTINDQPSRAPIRVGNHVWIGTKATILKGVTVGDGAIVAAGATVTQDIPARTLVAGCPARPIKTDVLWR